MTVQISPQKHALATDKRAGTEIVTECLKTTVLLTTVHIECKVETLEVQCSVNIESNPRVFLDFIQLCHASNPFQNVQQHLLARILMTFWREQYVYS